MEFLRQYLKIITYSVLGIIFAFSSFYFFANCYHYLELRRDYVADIDNLPIVGKINENLKDIDNNIKAFDVNKYKGSIPANIMMRIESNLKVCSNNINNDIYKEIIAKDRVSIVDVYNLRESYENNILNTCVVNGINWLILDNNGINSDTLNANKTLISANIDLLLEKTTYLKKDLLNNSSYYYNTNIAANSVKDNTKDGFYEVLDAYKSATDFILYISNWFKMEMEG